MGDRVQAVDRALQLLEEVAASPVPIATPELARRAGVNRATAWRLMNSLEHRDLVRDAGQQVDVARSAEDGRVPCAHEQRALEHEPIRVAGSREPAEEAPHRVELQEIVERARTGARG